MLQASPQVVMLVGKGIPHQPSTHTELSQIPSQPSPSQVRLVITPKKEDAFTIFKRKKIGVRKRRIQTGSQTDNSAPGTDVVASSGPNLGRKGDIPRGGEDAEADLGAACVQQARSCDQ